MPPNTNEEFEMVDSPDSAVEVQTGGVVEVNVDVLQFICALDDTGSMGTPIKYAREIFYACLQYLGGLVHSGVFTTLKVEVHLVGLNDWNGGSWTHPCKLYLNEAESIRAKRPVGFTFDLNPDDAASWEAGVAKVRDAITKMSEQVGTGGRSGGDAREEYATGINLVKEIVKRAATDYPGRNVKTFVLVCTDDAQHGMGHHGHSDGFPNGVSESDVYGADGERAYKFACLYAPDMHPTLGIPVWKPHPLVLNLRELLDIGATVVWTAVGAAATNVYAYTDWLGTMAAVLSSGNGILLSYAKPDANNTVPQTIVHLLNTLITSASISEELEPLRRDTLAAERAEKLMTAAVAATAGMPGGGGANNVLQGTPTSLEAAEVRLARLVLDVELQESQHNALMHSAETRSDSETVAHYRSLGAKLSNAGPEPPVFGVGDEIASYGPSPPRYRSLGSAMYDDDDEDFVKPVYRSLDGEGGSEVVATTPEPPPPPSRHLRRMMAATPKRAPVGV